jgi:hypothetical protein
MELDLLTPQQAGEQLHKSPGTLAIWRCAKRYPLAYVRLGNRIYYRRKDIEKFIESCIVDGKDRGKRPPFVSATHRQEIAREATGQL